MCRRLQIKKKESLRIHSRGDDDDDADDVDDDYVATQCGPVSHGVFANEKDSMFPLAQDVTSAPRDVGDNRQVREIRP